MVYITTAESITDTTASAATANAPTATSAAAPAASMDLMGGDTATTAASMDIVSKRTSQKGPQAHTCCVVHIQ